jgi:hypothetical protein
MKNAISRIHPQVTSVHGIFSVYCKEDKFEESVPLESYTGLVANIYIRYERSAGVKLSEKQTLPHTVISQQA